MVVSISCYTRVSTEDQNFQRQLEGTHEYAKEKHGKGLSKIDTFRDKSTGTNTSRDGYQEMLEAVEFGEVDTVIVKLVSRIAQSIRDLDRTVERIRGADASLYFIDEGLVLDADDDDPY